MPTKLEHLVRYSRNITIPFEKISPGENLAFPYYSILNQPMRFVARCLGDDSSSEIFIAKEKDVVITPSGLVIQNKDLIPISTLRIGEEMVFDLRKQPESPLLKLKVSHVPSSL